MALISATCAAAGLLWCGISLSAAGGSFTVFGPQVYTRQTGAPVLVRDTFAVRNPSAQYQVRIRVNGVASALVSELPQP